IDGRIPVMRAAEYLHQQSHSPTKQLLAVHFSAANPRDEPKLRTLWTYFHSRERYGVIGYTLASVKDMYIIPLAAGEPVPDFITSLPNDLANAPPDRDILVGVIVWNRPKATPSIPEHSGRTAASLTRPSTAIFSGPMGTDSEHLSSIAS